ncbi:CDP-alcohol phosphatidyltransferase family protein [Aliikangiella sp. IMCC44359]|uniref:CDP-alcohol phosphatidyltransferase family protein n=1 Tax=Aliikangiella sp. IMCC44359 TaxID=3459125 RepID=UPI00403AE134
MNLSFLPNLITLMRVVLLVPLTLFLLSEQYFIALVLFVVAGFSDALDGFLAKQFSWVSRFGAILDPLADKALLVITITILAYNQKLSWTLLSIVLIRDIYIVAGAYYFHYRLGPYDMQPSNLSKLNTFVQLLLVTVLLVSLGYYSLPDMLIKSLILLTYVTTITSGIHYGWVWGNKFSQAIKEKALLSKKESEHHDEKPTN